MNTIIDTSISVGIATSTRRNMSLSMGKTVRARRRTEPGRDSLARVRREQRRRGWRRDGRRRLAATRYIIKTGIATPLLLREGHALQADHAVRIGHETLTFLASAKGQGW